MSGDHGDDHDDHDDGDHHHGDDNDKDDVDDIFNIWINVDQSQNESPDRPFFVCPLCISSLIKGQHPET